MAAIGKLNVQLGVDLSKFRTDMNKAFNTLNSSTNQMKKSLTGLQNDFKAVTASINDLKTTITAIGAAGLAKNILMAADSFNQLQAKVKLSLQSASQFDGVFQKLVASSNRSGTAIDGVAQAFVRLRPAADNLGVSNDQLIRFNETFAKMGALAGATGEEIKNTMVQLSQGLASGTLRGDELRSVMEQMPQVARTIAESMGIPFEKFKQAAQDGKITADQVFKAIIQKSGEVDEAFSKLPPSIERAMNRMANSTTILIGKVDQVTGLTRTFAKIIDDLAKGLSGTSGMADDFTKGLQSLSEAVGSLSGAFIIMLNTVGPKLAAFFKNAAAGASIAALGIEGIALDAAEVAYSIKSIGPNNDKAILKEKQKMYEDSRERNKALFQALKLIPTDYTGPLNTSGAYGPKAPGKGLNIKSIVPDVKAKHGKVDPDISRAKTLVEQSATPLEKFKIGLAEADRMLKKHLITMAQYKEIVDKLDMETSKMVKVDPGMSDLTKGQQARVDFAKTSMYNLHKAVEDNLLKPGELFGKSLMEGFNSEMDQMKSADSIIDSVANSMQNYAKTVAELDRQLNAGNISQEQYSKALQNAKDAGFTPLYPEIRQYQKSLEDLNSLYQGGVITTYEYAAALKKLKDDVIAPILTPLEKYNEGIARLSALYNAGALSAEQMQRQMQALADDLIQGSQVFQDLQQFAGQSLSTIGDGFLNFAKTGKFAFKEMIASILEDMARLIIQLGIIQPLMAAAFGNQQTGGSGFIGKFIGGLIGRIGGGKATSPLGGMLGSNAPMLPPIKLGFAGGGKTPINQPFWVGEEGPELMTGDKSYRVFDNKTSMAMAGGGGAVTLNQYFTIQTIDNRDFEDRLSEHAKFIGNVSVQAIQRQENRMGRRGPMDTSRG